VKLPQSCSSHPVRSVLPLATAFLGAILASLRRGKTTKYSASQRDIKVAKMVRSTQIARLDGMYASERLKEAEC
jgi:hypothetical protein